MRNCSQNGQWNAPDVSNCSTAEQRMLETRAKKLVNLVNNEDKNLTQAFIPEEVEDIADELQEITNTTQPLLPNDVSSAANTLDALIE